MNSERAGHPENYPQTYFIGEFPLPREIVLRTAGLRSGESFQTIIAASGSPRLLDSMTFYVKKGFMRDLELIPFSAACYSSGLNIQIGPITMFCDVQHVIDSIQDQSGNF